MRGTGWIRELISAAEDAAEDLFQLDRDCHGPLERGDTCSWCRDRVRLRTAAKMAKRQVDAIELARLRRGIRR